MNRMISIPIYIYDGEKSEYYESMGIKKKEKVIAILHFRENELKGYFEDPPVMEDRTITFYTSFGMDYNTPYNEKTIKLFNDILNEKTT